MYRYLVSVFTAAWFVNPVQAQQFAQDDWAASRIGQVCYVFTTRAARDTSGALIFRFEEHGYNAGFAYEYKPWPGETEAPWDPDDFVLLEVDGEEVWLGEEMFAGQGATGYRADMTSGMVTEMIAGLAAAERSVSFSMERQAKGETWLYGLFSVAGFRETMAEAGALCQFDPFALPQS